VAGESEAPGETWRRPPFPCREAYGLRAAGGVVGEGDGGGERSAAAGVKVTLTVQLAPAATLARTYWSGQSRRDWCAEPMLVRVKRVAGIVHSYDLSRAGGAYGLAGESEAAG